MTYHERPAIGSTRAAAAGHSVQPRPDSLSWLNARTTLEVIPIRHPVIEALGHHPRSEFGERFWLPVIGPSSLAAYRRLTAGFIGSRSGYRLDVATLGREIGLGAGTGRSSPLLRTLSRLTAFHLAEIIEDRFGVYTSLPPLTRRQAARLPGHLAVQHRSILHDCFVDGSRPFNRTTAEIGR